MTTIKVGTRVYCDAEGNTGTVITPHDRVIFAEYGHPMPPATWSRKRVAAMHERCLIRGIPAEFEGSPVDPADFVAVRLDDNGGDRYWQISECVVTD